jgi:hypothetical protein
MRVFLCSFDGFSMAIPIDSASYIILYHGNADKAVDYNSESGNTYFSLPLLLDYPFEKIKHGIILKNGESGEDNSAFENKTVLLTTEIECEIEIQDEKIFPVQKTLKCMRFSFLFKGLLFDSDYRRMGNTILVLNPDYFFQNIREKEK